MARLPRLGRDDTVRLLGAGAGASVDLADVARQRRRRPRFSALDAPGMPPRAETPQNICADTTRILGLDLAMGTTGWCLLVGGQPTAHGSFVLPERARRETLAHWLGRRAKRLGEQVSLLLAAHQPEVVAFEYPDTYRRAWSGGSKGREFEVSQALGRVQGFLVALWPKIGGDVKLMAVSTSDAKLKATGRVDANKDQVRWALMTYRQWDLSGWTDDEVDAAAVALAAREGMA